MLRTFDHAGYYETRVILMVMTLAIAAYFFYYKRDRRFFLMFVSGVIFQTVMEYSLQLRGLRGSGYHLSIFGQTLPSTLGPIFQGISEGGVLSLFAFWFADLRAANTRAKEWVPFGILCGLVVGLAVVVGVVAQGRPISSPRPMFVTSSILIVSTVILVSLIMAWRKNVFSALVSFYAGMLLYVVLTFEPMHVMGVRYIGTHAGGQIIAAPYPAQLLMMLLSHIFEVAGGKLHYLMIPLALGLVSLRDREDLRERYSSQHLNDLVTRGWRKKSKFTKE